MNRYRILWYRRRSRSILSEGRQVRSAAICTELCHLSPTGNTGSSRGFIVTIHTVNLCKLHIKKVPSTYWKIAFTIIHLRTLSGTLNILRHHCIECALTRRSTNDDSRILLSRYTRENTHK